jgi:hypothetical protein
LNPEPPEDEAGLLTNRTRLSVDAFWVSMFSVYNILGGPFLTTMKMMMMMMFWVVTQCELAGRYERFG